MYATLGTQIDVVELGSGLMPGADRDLVKVWEKMNLSRFSRVMLNTKCVAAKAEPSGITVQFEGANGVETPAPGTYERVLVAVGRSPNGGKLSADKAGVIVDERGFIKVDNQMRTNVPHIFAIGDLVGQPMLAHKAVHEGHVAAEVAAGHKRVFDPLQIPSVLHRPRSCLDWPHRGAMQGQRSQIHQGHVPLGGLWSCYCERSRRGLHQAVV